MAIELFGDRVEGLAYSLAVQALDRAGLPVDCWPQHMADAKQEALLGLWYSRRRALRSENPMAYACQAGRRRVMRWVFHFLYEDRTNRPGAWRKVGHITHVPLLETSDYAADDDPRHRGPEDVLIAREEREGRQAQRQRLHDELTGFFLATRKKGGERGRAASERDADLVLLAMDGYSTAGIAQEIGLPVKHVETYLRQAWHRLSEAGNDTGRVLKGEDDENVNG